jgi:hypothetical protein
VTSRATSPTIVVGGLESREETMSDPKEEQRNVEELELDAETVKDLDVDENQGGQIRGGCSTSGTLSMNPN